MIYFLSCFPFRWRVRVEFLQADIFFEDTWDERISIGRIVSKYLNCSPDERQGCSISPSSSIASGVSSQNNSTPVEDPMAEHWSEPLQINNDAVRTNDNNSTLINNLSHKNEDANCKVSSDVNTETSPVLNHDVIDGTLNPEYNGHTTIPTLPDTPLVQDVTPAERGSVTLSLTTDQHQQMMFYEAAGLGQLAVLLKNEDFYDDRRYIELSFSDSLRDGLVNLRVVEYPVLTVVRRDHSYELLNSGEVEKSRRQDSPAKQNHCKEELGAESTLKYFDADFSDEDMEN